MQCLNCRTTPSQGKCVVYLTLEDKKGSFQLCSACWIERNRPDVILEKPAPKKRKRKK